MKFNFVLNQPWWTIVLCIAAGIAFAIVLYYKNTSDDFKPWKQWTLASFRFLLVFIICLLLLAPLLEMQTTKTNEPLVLVFQDNTESLLATPASDSAMNTYKEQLVDFSNKLENSYSVITYTYGEQVQQRDTFTFNEKTTNISQIFESLDVLYSNRNVGAVIITGDGIFNRGQNPVFQKTNHLFPIYTIALGDTIPHKDLIVNHVRHNRITYLNNIFPLEVTLEARQAEGSRSTLKVTQQGNTLFEQNISITSDNYFQTIPIQLEATDIGMKRYRIEFVPVEGEISVENNVREFFIEVIDSRQKLAIIAAGPHPDVGALKLALDENENFETQVFLADDFTGELSAYDIIIWHQLPSQRNTGTPLVNSARQTDIPQLFIIGTLSNITAFNQLQTGVEINTRAAGFNDSRAEVNTTFTLFQLRGQTSALLPLFPPLQTPFASFALTPATQVLAYQKIGNVSTDFPLIAFSQTTNKKTGVITGEGIWRWRLDNYARNNNHEVFNDLVSRMIQFLTVVEDKSFFRVMTQNFLYQNQPAIFEAELYNPSYELVNTPEVSLTITDEEGAEFEYIFGPTQNAYRLNAGTFPVGEYRYQASVSLGNEQFSEEGIFTVAPLNIEDIRTVANHQLLFQLASNTGGKMFYPNQLDELLDEIKNRENIKPVLHAQNKYEELINLRWIFFLLLILLSVEWFIRKYSGSY